jgi:hypothetical protein
VRSGLDRENAVVTEESVGVLLVPRHHLGLRQADILVGRLGGSGPGEKDQCRVELSLPREQHANTQVGSRRPGVRGQLSRVRSPGLVIATLVPRSVPVPLLGLQRSEPEENRAEQQKPAARPIRARFARAGA